MARRDVFRAGALGLLLTSAGGLLEACGGSDGGPGRSGGIRLVAAPDRRASADPALIGPAVRGLDGFAARLYAATAASADGNVVISPYSVAVALSMTLAGARGRTATELRSGLGAGGLGDAWHDAMNALTAYVDGLAGRVERGDGSSAEIKIATADALFGQRGVEWQQQFLEVLARDYGAGMQTVDYTVDPDHVADLVNAWVADHTDDRIKDLIAHGVLGTDTRLTLVNAISLTAPWESPFERADTHDGTFHLAAGGSVRAPMMTRSSVDVLRVDGDGWRAARIPYAGSTLAMTVVVPDDGRLADVEAGLVDGGLTEALSRGRAANVALTLPRWTSRTSVSLKQALQALGVKVAFTDAADFSAMTSEQALEISDVLHQGYIKVDEDGTEAAAATAVVMTTTGAPVVPESFVVDRPFLYVLHDTAHGAPLFVGRVTDPT